MGIGHPLKALKLQICTESISQSEPFNVTAKCFQSVLTGPTYREWPMPILQIILEIILTLCEILILELSQSWECQCISKLEQFVNNNRYLSRFFDCLANPNHWSKMTLKSSSYLLPKFCTVPLTIALEPICCKKRPKIVPDQLLVWGIRALWRFWMVPNWC